MECVKRLKYVWAKEFNPWLSICSFGILDEHVLGLHECLWRHNRVTLILSKVIINQNVEFLKIWIWTSEGMFCRGTMWLQIFPLLRCIEWTRAIEFSDFINCDADIFKVFHCVFYERNAWLPLCCLCLRRKRLGCIYSCIISSLHICMLDPGFVLPGFEFQGWFSCPASQTCSILQ